jgi:hypothetical protein
MQNLVTNNYLAVKGNYPCQKTYECTCKGWANEAWAFSYGGVMVVAWFHKTMAQVTIS